MPMTVSPAGIDAIKRREGFTATPKSDGARQEIGYGHDIQPGENIPSPIDESAATQLLENDLAHVLSVINDSVSVPLNQNQFDALASFVYNIGANAFRNSTLLKLLNQGDYAGAAAQFARWNMFGGHVNAGLVARRKSEAAQFTSPVEPTSRPAIS
jgi:GH24 family phage-related lysozyme (muramidase)